MSVEIKKENWETSGFYKICFALFLSLWLVVTTTGQTTDPAQTASAETVKDKVVLKIVLPAWTNYREIKIGMSAEEVRERLGKAVIDDRDGFYYQVSDEEAVQIRIDEDKKVRFISVDYSGKAGNQPKFEDVFGKDAKMEAKPEGSVYKIVRYPEAGYWVAYSRTAGENPIVTITMQKMR